jgi:hypothetical protein
MPRWPDSAGRNFRKNLSENADLAMSRKQWMEDRQKKISEREKRMKDSKADELERLKELEERYAPKSPVVNLVRVAK